MRRKGVSKLKPHYQYTIYPNVVADLTQFHLDISMFFIISIKIRFENIHYNTGWLFSTIGFKNQSSFGLRYINRTEYIPYDFDPSGVDELNKVFYLMEKKPIIQ